MSLQEWVQLFTEQIKETPFIEWIAVAASVAEVLLAWRNNVLLYPAGIISTLLFIYILADAGLYSESILSLYYFIMSVYGWLHLIKRKNQPPLPVSMTTKKEWLISAGIILVSMALFYSVIELYLHKYNNHIIAIWDAWVSATAWAGMWLLAKRKLENWIVLNLSNIFAIPLLMYKKLPLTSCLTLFLFIVAIFGYIEWRKIYHTQNTSKGSLSFN
jgi:nicotinamide mononucleotide transporter